MRHHLLTVALLMPLALGATSCQELRNEPPRVASRDAPGDAVKPGSPRPPSTAEGESSASPALAVASTPLSLSVVVKNLRNGRGRVAIAIFQSPDGFPDQQNALATQASKAAETQVIAQFEDLEPGRYAIAIHHDENANGAMDYNLLGMPLEGFGFSNGAKVSFGPPSFERAAFEAAGDQHRETVHATYF